jgi:SAM-dependent methyltransferase
MMTRTEKILYCLNEKGAGLEIGPSVNPVAPKRGGYAVHILDHLSREKLMEKYGSQNVPTEKIEEVDFVWNGEPYAELIGKTQCYDWVIASHVIEHTPDLVGFLRNCESILKPEGVLSLVVPDKRYCFDHARSPTSIAPIIDASLERRTRHTPGSLADYFLNVSRRNGLLSWDEKTCGPDAFIHGLLDAKQALDPAFHGSTYHDIHNWCFTPMHFRLLMRDLADLGLTGLREAAFFPTVGHEFFVSLSFSGRNFILSRLDAASEIAREWGNTSPTARKSDAGWALRGIKRVFRTR